MDKHLFWMVIGCTVPLLLIFLMPLLGISGTYAFFILIVAIFACHLLMPMHHGDHENDVYKEHSETTNTDKHETHHH